jgi:hypothetical protein
MTVGERKPDAGAQSDRGMELVRMSRILGGSMTVGERKPDAGAQSDRGMDDRQY